MYTLSIDGLKNFQLVELDGVPVQPVTLTSVTLNVAQRASIVVDWKKLDGTTKKSPALAFHINAMPARLPLHHS